jgi:kynurenine formamidase
MAAAEGREQGDALTALLATIGQARLFDLAHPWQTGMPQSPNHPPFRLVLERRHGDRVRPDGSSAASELLILGGHVGTHIDALCHVSYQGALHGGVPAEVAQAGGRFSTHGVETIPPLVARAVLLDVARARGEAVLPPAYAVGAADLEAAEEGSGTRLAAGDVALIRTGWARHFDDPPAFVGVESGVPGVDEEGAAWLAARKVRAVGGDTIAFERIPPGVGHRLLPVHRLLLFERGIPIMETLNLEELAAAGIGAFLFVALPLRLVGATGSPIRPLAVVP